MDACNRERLSALADGELSPGERKRALAHLKRCGACRQALRGFRRLKSAVKNASKAPPVPRDLADSILARLRKPRSRGPARP